MRSSSFAVIPRWDSAPRGYPPEFHLPVWRVGLIFYLIRQRRGTILLLDIVWAGP
jgi:hypothetical protein